MTTFRIQFPAYTCPPVPDISTSASTTGAASIPVWEPPVLARGLSERILHPLFAREAGAQALGPPRYFQNAIPVDAARLSSALLPHCQRTTDLVTRLFPRDRETLLRWIATWPAEYRLAFFVVLPRIWDDQKKAVEDNVGDGLFGPVTNLAGPDEFVGDLLSRFHTVQDWFDSFHRPQGMGQRWRRRVASCRDAAEFHANFRSNASGDLPFRYSGKNFLLARAAVEKMAAWAGKFSDGWRLETTGAFVGEETSWGKHVAIALRDFLPSESINGDPALAPGPAYPSAVIVGNDPQTPHLIGRMQDFLRKGTRTATSPFPLRCYFHSHPLAYDRPSLEDLSIVRGKIEFLYSPAKRGLIAWGEAGERRPPRDYYARPFDELEALGFFRTVAAI